MVCIIPLLNATVCDPVLPFCTEGLLAQQEQLVQDQLQQKNYLGWGIFFVFIVNLAVELLALSKMGKLTI